MTVLDVPSSLFSLAPPPSVATLSCSSGSDWGSSTLALFTSLATPRRSSIFAASSGTPSSASPGFADYSEMDLLDLRYKPVNFGGTHPSTLDGFVPFDVRNKLVNFGAAKPPVSPRDRWRRICFFFFITLKPSVK